MKFECFFLLHLEKVVFITNEKVELKLFTYLEKYLYHTNKCM